jgi:hypothetical protein
MRKITTLLEPHIMRSSTTIDQNVETLTFQNLFMVFVYFKSNYMAVDISALSSVIVLTGIVE